MPRHNRNLIIIAIISVVNALGYGIIIPILYSYSKTYGLSDFQNGLLFSVFSLCQLIATPVIGQLSDRFGRKPLLILSVGGTAISFFMMAFAPNALILFLARALDGITAGNLPVAQAVISDSTEPQQRAKGFGIIGASFGFGFIAGPALSAFTLGWGPEVPFVFAGIVSTLAVLLTWIFLPETNTHKQHDRAISWINFRSLFAMLGKKVVGQVLAISLLYSFAFSLYIYAFQPYAVKGLLLTAQQISMLFMLVGIVGLFTQVMLFPRLVEKFEERKLLIISSVAISLVFLVMFMVPLYVVFVAMVMAFAIANACINPLLQGMLSRSVDPSSQGSIMGVNSSYISIGMIVGPILGGALAMRSIALPFFAGALIVAVVVHMTTVLHVPATHKG